MNQQENKVIDVEDTAANIVEQSTAQNSPPLPASPPLVSQVAGEICEGVVSTSRDSTIATAPEKGGETGESGVSHMAEGQAVELHSELTHLSI